MTNPYVGPRAFKYGENLYGRDQEVKDLRNLLIARRIVLLYSPSGAGKTSLIQAGLIKALEKEGFRVLPVMRPGHEPPPEAPEGANRYLLSVLMDLQKDLPPKESTPATDLAQITLAEFLKAHGEDANEVLIFDQFEEILTHDPIDEAAKEEFFQQVGEVLEQDNRWALFAMREEYVAGLDPYRRAIPTRLKTDFRLKLLGLVAAHQAIQEPPKLVGGEFTDAAAKKLVKDLSRVYVPGKEGIPEPRAGLSVEPVQLQVVCQRVWTKYGEDDLKIDEDEIQDIGDVNTALAEYYAEQVAAAAQKGKVSERRIRSWVSSHLLTKHGLRGQVMKASGETEGLDNKVIQTLMEAHLVREDTRGTRTYYELAHDRLIEPIRDNNEAWLQDHLNTLQLQAELWNRKDKLYDLLLTGEEYIKGEQWAASHQDQMTDNERDFLARSKAKYLRSKRHKRMAIWACIFGLVAMIAGLFAFMLFFTAKQQAILADQQKRLAIAGRRASSAFSQLHIDPERSTLLALEAVNEVKALKATKIKDPQILQRAEVAMLLAENALHRAMFTSRVKSTLRKGQARGGAAPPDTSPPDKAAQQDQISQVFFCPAGRRFATISLDKAVKVWDGATGKYLRPPHEVKVNWASFNRDGSLLALACKDNTAKIWHLDQQKMDSLPHDREVLRVYFNKPGTYLATTDSSGGNFLVWKTDDLQLLGVKQHGDLQDLVFSPDGKFLATAGWDGQVKMWRFPSEIKQPKIDKVYFCEHGRSLKRIYFSPDGTRLATVSSDDGLVKVWETSSQEPASSKKPLRIYQDVGLEMAFSSDNKLLALANKYDHVVHVLDIARGIHQAKFPGHTDTITKLVFLPNGKDRFLLSASEDGMVKMWDIAGNRELFSLAGHRMPIQGMAVYPDSDHQEKNLVSVGSDGQMRVWDIRVGHTSAVNKVIFNPKGTRLATVSNNGTARIWDTKTDSELHCFMKNQKRIKSVVFRSRNDKEEFVTATTDGIFNFWTLSGEESGDEIHFNDILKKTTSVKEVNKIENITFSPLGTYAVVQAVLKFPRGYHPKVLLYNPDLFNPKKEISESPRIFPSYTYPEEIHLQCLAISRDEKKMAIGLSNGKIEIWDLQSNSEPVLLPGHQGEVLSLAFNPREDYLASAGADLKVKLWKWNARDQAWEDEPKTFPGFGGSVVSVAFSHDGQRLAAGSKDRWAKIFDLKGRELHSFSHPAGINHVAFNPDPDAHQLAVGCDDNCWYIHPLDLDKALVQAEGKLTRNKFTEEECRLFGLDRSSTPGICADPLKD